MIPDKVWTWHYISKIMHYCENFILLKLILIESSYAANIHVKLNSCSSANAHKMRNSPAKTSEEMTHRPDVQTNTDGVETVLYCFYLYQ